MAIEIPLPPLGENIESATVTRVLVKVGDAIKKDQSVLELDTEKASVDVPAPSAGTVKEIRVKEGDVLNVGQIVMTLDGTADSPQPQAQQRKQESAPPPPPPPPKAEAPEPPQPVERPEQAPEPEPEAAPPVATAPPEVPASPALRRMARELGVDIHSVKGTGPENRITEEDVRNHAKSIIAGEGPSGVRAKNAPLPDFSRWGQVERHSMSSIRRAIAEHLSGAWNSIPHVTHFDSADITELEAYRKSLDKGENSKTKVTMTAIAMKVVSQALKVFPQFATSLDIEKGEVISKKYCHIGVAVDTEHGLLVPVIRDVDKKGILAISQELAQAAEKARARTLSIDEMQGGTFTVTNLGGIGGMNFTPIINSPEIAILGISRSSLQPVFRDGGFVPRLMLPLALSFDHRVVDGADSARFLRWIVEALEQPLRLVL
jgi:pyruvate dehydrogenase E2 component (dihydrolipoamide acetyltransferase)